MKKLTIIVEGDTEKKFVDVILMPYLRVHGIHNYSCYKISKTNGGLTHYQHLRKDLQRAINEGGTVVTTLIDYYALPDDFPNYKGAIAIIDKNTRLSFLEQAILKDLQGGSYLPNFIPYIQLHEFEALTLLQLMVSKSILIAKRPILRHWNT